ncbi:hypothetical protein Drose_04470 [Dactylosporangium roseum]|uniref:Small CPxCG-related zinc finger protein n=1 Tax=Dactylosporangium roseum TaxID=47989 RepID=A0ABY5ZB00_9ACTN|nr:hypothetical protein [Dactylosporangium roseum]UWZ37544.1 hypothetical protein Drose_04470 [Dactylosporangium roseum]
MATVVYRCDICEMAEKRQPVLSPAGTDDDSARVAGWRIGASQAKERNVVCPECAGTDEGYWDRRMLDVAYMSGMHRFLLPGSGEEAAAVSQAHREAGAP